MLGTPMLVTAVLFFAQATPPPPPPPPPPATTRAPAHAWRAALDQSRVALDALGPQLAGLEGLQGLAGLQGLDALSRLDGLDGLDALDALDGLDGLDRLDAFDAFDAFDALDALDALDGPSVRYRNDTPSWSDDAADDPQDPADSLYRAARRTLNSDDYNQAAAQFAQMRRRYPRSSYVAEALYWEAFALYRSGAMDDLKFARQRLTEQLQRFPATATHGDALTLATRIDGELARRGDADARARVQATATTSTATAPATSRMSTQACAGEDDDDDPRIAALNALLQMDAESALPILRKVLERRDACSVTLRRKAMFIVSQKRSAATEDILLNSARNDPDGEVRGQAIFWLSQVNTERSVDMLDSIVRTTTDEEILDKAIFALSQQRSPKAAQALRNFAERTNAPEDAREKAIFWLGQSHSAENGAFLRALYGKLTEQDLKEKVIFSVSQTGDAENSRWLMGIALNEQEDIEMRKKALFWACQSRCDIAQLAQLYDRIQDQEMKEQLIFVYSQRHDPAAVDKLFDIAKNERDRELRKKAIFWLGQSHDPRVPQFLQDLLGNP